MHPVYVIKVKPDGTKLMALNLMEETDVPETVDSSITSFDSDTSVHAEEITEKLRNDIVESSNVLFPSSTDGEGAKNGDSKAVAVANSGIRSGKTTSGLEVDGDGSELLLVNIMKEIDALKAVDDKWKNIVHDALSTSSDIDTSANAKEKTEKLRKDIVKLRNVLFPTKIDGEGAENEESESVANTGIRSGKMMSALEDDGDGSEKFMVNLMENTDVSETVDDVLGNVVCDASSTSSEENTGNLRKDIVKSSNVLFPSSTDGEGAKNGESEAVANTGIHSVKTTSALENDGDGFKRFMVNLMEDTGIPETEDNVCANISSDSGTSANAEENTENLLKDTVKLSPSSTDGEGAENGESEAVASTGIRSGKKTSALEVDGSEYIRVHVNLIKIPDVMETVDDVWKNIVSDALSTSFDIDTSANAVKSTYTGKPRNDKVKLNSNVLFPSSSDGEGAKNGESAAVANIGIRSGKTTSALKVNGDGSELCLVNVEDTDVPETVDDVWANIVRDASVTSSDSDTSANAVENTGKLRKDKPNLIVNVAFPRSSGGEGAENGESEAVANTGVGSGKTTSVLKPSPSVGVSLENFLDKPIGGTGKNGGGENGSATSMMEEAWEQLSRSYVSFKGQRVGTIAAIDDSGSDTLNYNQVFVRDFVPFGLACLMKADADVDIVKNFLLKTLHLQGWEKRIDNFTLGEGVMPASFKVIHDPIRQKEVLQADFGGSAIGRVAPVDSGFWWIILLRSYTKCTHDYSLSELPEVQRGIKLILNLCLSDGFDTFPTLLCADGCSMIDRRMGVYGYPIEIQALFFFALRCARQLLKPEHDGKELIERIDKRITALSYHIQNYYWLDFTQLNNIYRYKTEEYSHTAVNKFNVIPESIPDWVFEFMPLRGGYFIGNVSPARMDFRWFLLGNCIAILSSLATPAQATAVMDLIEERWADLIGEMPLKITYPALEGHEWKIVTGCDPKNTRWSYHNGGSWPVLLWLLTAASIKTGRPQIAKRAIELVEQRLSKDGWPEYYDGITGRYIGKQARKYQTWSIAGYLVSKLMIENPSNLLIISLEEDKKIAKPRLTRSASWTY